jgi:hypothetical protein
MNIATDRMCASEPDIASKVMDGEAILINLQTGAYYSLRDAGALAWEAVRGHRTLDEIVAILASAYGRTPAELAPDLTVLLATLEAERLIRASDQLAAADTGALPPPTGSYQPPTVEKFTDMEELLALDPPIPGALDGLMRQPYPTRDA